MKIGLIDVDGYSFPNLALRMKEENTEEKVARFRINWSMLEEELNHRWVR